MKALDKEKIETIISDLVNNRCMLFIGPDLKGIETKSKPLSFPEIYSNFFIEKLESQKIEFLKQENNHYYYYAQKVLKKNRRVDLHDEIKIFAQKSNFYGNDNYYMYSTIYSSLAKLPFNTIVNFGSDTLMIDALKNQGFDIDFFYYNYNAPGEDKVKDRITNEEISESTPLVYNVFGLDSNARSLIWTEDDQLKFYTKIMTNQKIPTNIRTRFEITEDKPKSFIFLGFDFKEWPFRIILDLLGIPKNEYSITATNQNANIAVITEEFYHEKFGLDFINNDCEEFVSTLFQAYANKNNKLKKNAFLSFHKEDEDIFKKFIVKLSAFPMYQKERIKFLNNNDLIAGDETKKELKKAKDNADIYIPFISSAFVEDPDLEDELNTMKKRSIQGQVLIYAILVDSVIDSVIRDLLKYRIQIFPGENSPLKRSQKSPSDEEIISVLKKINIATR